MYSKQIWIVLASMFAVGQCMQDLMQMDFPHIFTVNCSGQSIDQLKPLSTIEHHTKINITQCLTPNTSYADALQRLNIDVSVLTSLTLDTISNWKALRGTHLAGLNLTTLMIHNHDDSHMVILPDDITNYLIGTLKVLHVIRVKMNNLPEDIKLENATLIRGFTLDKWGGCRDLKKIEIMHWVVPAYEYGWLPHCTKLEELTLFHAMEQTVRHTLIGLRSVKRMTIRKCALLYITASMFEPATQLRTLEFTHHSIYGMNPQAFKHQTQLQELDMSYNELFDTAELALVYTPLLSLKTLNLAYNPLRNFCGSWNKTSLPIQHLSLRSTQLSKLCFSEWEHLEKLDLASNNITELQIAELPAVHQLPLEVDLRKNPITKLPDTEEDYYLMKDRFSKGRKVTIHLDLTVDCDCAHAWLARALHELPRLYVTGIRCTSGESIYRVPQERLTCDKWSCSGCQCRRQWLGHARADCSRQDRGRLPLLGTTEQLETVTTFELPSTVQHIDLRHNRIAFMTPTEATELFAEPDRTVSLAGNPLICDCDTAGMIGILMKNKDQILDFDNLTCVNDGSPLSKIVLDDLCDDELAQIWPPVAIVAVIGTVIAALAALYWRYENQIKMYLYTRGCCLSCLHEEDVDSERTFDAFIAFSHEDDDFVNLQLIPGLMNYNLCVHYKNWIPGDWIPAQIARSIEQSKRTIIVLSKNFLKSPWGMLEFRMAHAAMLHEGRARIIAVVTDDVVQASKLDAELRGYLAANTYIVWGDPWFFDKLRYALPHKRNPYDNTKFDTVQVKGYF